MFSVFLLAAAVDELLLLSTPRCC